jgi:hypothetical protein
MIYSIGIDLGLYGAIALITPYLKDSIVIPTPKADKWVRPLEVGEAKGRGKTKTVLTEEDVFRTKGKNKGDRLYSQHPSWGGNILRHEAIVEAVKAGYDKDLYAVQSYLEDPGAQGGTRAGFDNSKTVGLNTYPWILAMEQLTCKQPWRVSVREWQTHPAIATWGKVDYSHDAKDKSEGKKHQAIALANELFSKNISFDMKKHGDGMADALLIGLYGALKFPPVVQMNAVDAWLALEHEQSNHLVIPTDIPFTEALIYAEDLSMEEYQQRLGSFNYGGSEAPSMERIKQGGIVGYVTLGERQRITSRVVYPDVVKFEMGGKAIAPYYDQLPHLIK